VVISVTACVQSRYIPTQSANEYIMYVISKLIGTSMYVGSAIVIVLRHASRTASTTSVRPYGFRHRRPIYYRGSWSAVLMYDPLTAKLRLCLTVMASADLNAGAWCAYPRNLTFSLGISTYLKLVLKVS
jgi:hypothetical protein